MPACRITSYNVCYTKLLRIPLGKLLREEPAHTDKARAVVGQQPLVNLCCLAGISRDFSCLCRRITSYNVCYTKLLRLIEVGNDRAGLRPCEAGVQQGQIRS